MLIMSQAFPNAIDQARLDEVLLDERGQVRILPAAEFQNFSQEQLSVWCHRHAVYQLPTLELIDFLRSELVGISLEIGAGNGCIGRALGIIATDSYLQRRPDVAMIYAMSRQPTVKYGLDVLQMTADTAVFTYRPDTVLGCWVTQQANDGSGNPDGIDEIAMLRQYEVRKYIIVGDQVIHGNKKVLKHYPHQVLSFPWLYSRSQRKHDNRIYIIDV